MMDWLNERETSQIRERLIEVFEAVRLGEIRRRDKEGNGERVVAENGQQR